MSGCGLDKEEEMMRRRPQGKHGTEYEDMKCNWGKEREESDDGMRKQRAFQIITWSKTQTFMNKVIIIRELSYTCHEGLMGPHALMIEMSSGRVHHCPTFQSRVIPSFLFSRGDFSSKLLDLKWSSKYSPHHSIVVLPSQKSIALPTRALAHT